VFNIPLENRLSATRSGASGAAFTLHIERQFSRSRTRLFFTDPAFLAFVESDGFLYQLTRDEKATSPESSVLVDFIAGCSHGSRSFGVIPISRQSAIRLLFASSLTCAPRDGRKPPLAQAHPQIRRQFRKRKPALILRRHLTPTPPFRVSFTTTPTGTTLHDFSCVFTASSPRMKTLVVCDFTVHTTLLSNPQSSP
jgi:hypothetical protein